MKAPNCKTALYEAQRALLLDAASLVRRRYVRAAGGDHSLAPEAAERLANIFEGMARAEPALNKLDRDEAIALAHRLIDDDHPEDSRMWPA